MIYLLQMVIFHSYVSLPEGKYCDLRNETLLSDVAKQGFNSVVQTNWVSASDSRWTTVKLHLGMGQRPPKMDGSTWKAWKLSVHWDSGLDHPYVFDTETMAWNPFRWNLWKLEVVLWYLEFLLASFGCKGSERLWIVEQVETQQICQALKIPTVPVTVTIASCSSQGLQQGPLVRQSA